MVAVSNVYGSTIFIKLTAQDNAKRVLEATRKSIQGIKQSTSDAATEMVRFNMQTLSFMFGGMALKRVGESFFRFAFNSWEKYEGWQSKAIESTMQLTASWEFLRFSIFNALGQSELFQSMVSAVISMVDWVSQLASKHPDLVAFAGVFSGLAFTLGSVAMGVGVVWQIWQMSKWTKVFLSLKFGGSAIMKGLAALEILLIGTSRKGGILASFKKIHKWIKSIYLLKFGGTILDVALTAMLGSINKIVKSLKAAYNLMKTMGLVGTIAALAAAAPAVVAGAIVVAGTAAGYGTGKYLEEKEAGRLMEEKGLTKEEAIAEITKAMVDSLKEGPLKVELVNPEVINTDLIGASPMG